MPPKKKGKLGQNVYEKAEDLPEGRKKIYDSILEDFDKQGQYLSLQSLSVKKVKLQRTNAKIYFSLKVEARIEQIKSAIGAMQKQIKSQFKVALLQQSRATRQLKVEDFYYENGEIGDVSKVDLNVECAKLAVSISNNISKEVKTTVKGATSKKQPAEKMQPSATSTRRRTKKSSILGMYLHLVSSDQYFQNIIF